MMAASIFPHLFSECYFTLWEYILKSVVCFCCHLGWFVSFYLFLELSYGYKIWEVVKIIKNGTAVKRILFTCSQIHLKDGFLLLLLTHFLFNRLDLHFREVLFVQMFLRNPQNTTSKVTAVQCKTILQIEMWSLWLWL